MELKYGYGTKAEQMLESVTYYNDTRLPEPFTLFNKFKPSNKYIPSEVVEYAKNLQGLFYTLFGIIAQKYKKIVEEKPELVGIAQKQIINFFRETRSHLEKYVEDTYPRKGRYAPENKQFRRKYFQDLIMLLYDELEKIRYRYFSKNIFNKMEKKEPVYYDPDLYREYAYDVVEPSDDEINNLLRRFEEHGVTARTPAIFTQLPINERTPQKWRG